MTAGTELKNFIDHYGLEETVDALANRLNEIVQDDEKRDGILKHVKSLHTECEQILYDWGVEE